MVDVAQDTDTKRDSPCLIRKSDGASFATSDLPPLWNGNRILPTAIFMVDKRQGMHLEQVVQEG